MKILITGSSGMLGTDLCEVLKADHELAGMDTVRPRSEGNAPHLFHEANVTDPERVKEIFDKEEPELVIHAAAWTDVDGCERDPEKAFLVNTEGTHNVVDASRDGNVPLIFISTDFVFDGDKGEPYREDDRTNPLNVYGRSKLEAEEVIKRGLSRYAIVRTSWLFGMNGRNFVRTVIEKGRKEGRVRVVDDQAGSPTYTGDLAGALKDLAKLVDEMGQDIYHVSNSGWCSWYDLALSISERLSGTEDFAVEPVTSVELDRPAKRPGFSALDCSAFEKRTGHKMRPWQDALGDYIEQFKREEG
jgi:dTDP-4-dehydrorhamnose reductase